LEEKMKKTAIDKTQVVNLEGMNWKLTKKELEDDYSFEFAEEPAFEDDELFTLEVCSCGLSMFQNSTMDQVFGPDDIDTPRTLAMLCRNGELSLSFNLPYRKDDLEYLMNIDFGVLEEDTWKKNDIFNLYGNGFSYDVNKYNGGTHV
jgi:hypothetical protein